MRWSSTALVPLTALLLSCAAAAPQGEAHEEDALSTLVATERAFAHLAEERGVRDAFLSYLARDAVTFSPAPERGWESWQKRAPLPPGQKPRRALLWTPMSGDLSAAGDLGWTTGPFVVRDTSGHEPDAHGLFFSVWRREPSGEFRVALDIGVDLPAPAASLDVAFAPATPKPAPLAPEEGPLNDPVALDRELDAKLAAASAVEALRASLAEGARMHRQGQAPLVGKGAIVAWATEKAFELRAEPIAGQMARSGDLGYSYGRYHARVSGVVEDGYYARVWQKQPDGRFLVVAEVELPAKTEAPPVAVPSPKPAPTGDSGASTGKPCSIRDSNGPLEGGESTTVGCSADEICVCVSQAGYSCSGTCQKAQQKGPFLVPVK